MTYQLAQVVGNLAMARDWSTLASTRICVDVVFLAMALEVTTGKDEFSNKLSAFHTSSVICFERVLRRLRDCSSNMSR